MVRDRDKRPPRGPSGSALLLSVCVGGVLLLEDLLAASRSMERDLLSDLLIYPRIFLRIFIADERHGKPSQGNQDLLVVKDKSWKTPDKLGVNKSMECDIFPSVL